MCVTACPAGAISSPTATPAALAAQIETVAVAAGAPIGIAFRCSHADARPLADGWQVVQVPCTGMVTAPWAIAPLLLGAAQVAVLRCSTTGCDRALDEAAEIAVAFATDLLTALGIAKDRVALTTDPIVHDPLPAVPVADPFGPRAAAHVYAGLRTAAENGGTQVTGTAAMLGVVTIDRDTCTMCTMCTQMCPTGALAGAYSDDGALTISFDPVECTACDQCIAVCPEVERGAIAVDHRVDFTALAAGRVELNRSATHICERCGQPVAPTAMMERLGEILGDDPRLMSQLTTLCLACRGSS
jgi:ferredoxin